MSKFDNITIHMGYFSKEKNLNEFVNYVIGENNADNIFAAAQIFASKQILSACISYLIFNIDILEQPIEDVIKLLSLDENTLDILFDECRPLGKTELYYSKYKASGDFAFRKNVRDLCITKLSSIYNLEKPVNIESSDNIEQPKTIYQYFVSYAYTGEDGIFGIANNSEVYTLKEFADACCIEELTNAVKEKFGYLSVVLINWKLIKKIDSPNNDVLSDKEFNISNEGYKHIESIYKN